MTIPMLLFQVILWLALVAIAGGVVYLLVLLVDEWRRGNLW